MSGRVSEHERRERNTENVIRRFDVKRLRQGMVKRNVVIVYDQASECFLPFVRGNMNTI